MNNMSNKDIQIVKPTEFQSSKFSIKIKKTGSGKQIKLTADSLYNDKPFLLETPLSATPYGLQKFAFKDSEPKWSIDITNNPDSLPFFSEIQLVDTYMVNQGLENSTKLFGKKYTSEQKDIVSAFYVPTVKNDEPPIRMKLSVEPVSKNGKKTDVPNLTVFQKKNFEPIEFKSFEDLQKNVSSNDFVKAILQPYPWIIHKQRFGIKWIVVQLLIDKPITNSKFS